jgi:hypothetical protein
MRGLRVTGLLLLLSGTACAADLSWIEVDGIRIVEPPSEHLRLSLRAQHLDDVRRRMTHPALRSEWQAIEAAARENTQARIEVEALRFLLDRDAKAGRETVAGALALLRKTRPEDAPEANSSRKIGLKLPVTDLGAGTWQVWRDGQIVLPALPVSNDAGFTYFHGPAGRYALRR